LTNTPWWDTQKVRDTFTDEDAARILKIKPGLGTDDTDVWGFTKDGIYTTKSAYKMLSKQSLAQGNIKSFPWILWNLWKGRNALVFEKSRLSASSCVSKALEEAEIWNKVNLKDDTTHMSRDNAPVLQNLWVKPPPGFIKCNVGMAWNNAGPLNGASWVTRDNSGRPIHHSRRAFSQSSCKRESDLKALLWAVEAMDSLKQKKVIFEASSVELLPLSQKILTLLHHFEEWSIFHVSGPKNRVATAIAESVVSGARTQIICRVWGAPMA
ncbi:hypothetical protein IGI04_015099, partial [Brassica rapa subsp. trilocularis]